MTKGRVLVVEPEDLVRRAILNHLHAPDYETYGVATLEHALEEIEGGFVPEAMIIDQLEWELAEETLQKRVRKHLQMYQLMVLIDEDTTRSAKIAFLTLTDPGDFMTKPFNIEELRLRLGSLIYMVRRQ
jgi:two-component system, sensor histidine kinase ChiS